ncbi:helix-turn-helix domain-containing protein [Faecalispora jeddahensis]|uniref:helix-turn-helix domain-containing protein n=1 Tax=Faecalispora jeddahensis TaxID=1414721 RepID=UPI001896FDC9|nr:helix-turn-helix domain-containing protein [Faecalispora jeddahensis]MDU6306665.1 helix-turn-helix domain-containing protein [Clostridium sp.]MDU6347408.1 helix-turn-helix domain-containing protein [Clostridium sp.]
MDYEVLGQFLKNCRTQLSITQQEVALKLGVTFQNVSSWERGKSKIDIDTLVRLCNIYEVNFIDALNKANENENSPAPANAETGELNKQEQTLIHNYRALNDEGQEKLFDYSEDLVSSGRYTKNNQPEISHEA